MITMTRLRAAILSLAMAAAWVGPAARAGPPPAPGPPPTPKAEDPPPPASQEVGDVEAWASAYLDREMWTLITHDTEGARFARPEGGKITSPFTIETDIRTELFQPIKLGPGWARSGIAHWSVDCARTRYVVMSMTIYSHNNMRGELAKKGQADKEWMTPNESQTVMIGVICKAVLSGKPLEQAPSPS